MCVCVCVCVCVCACVFRWRGLPATPSICLLGQTIPSSCMFSAQILICLRLPSSSHQDPGFLALHYSRQGPAFSRSGLSSARRGAGGPRAWRDTVGWRSATHTLNFTRLWRGGVSRPVIWRPLFFPLNRGETSLGKMGLYRVRVSTGSSCCAGSNNQVHLWLVGEHGEAALGWRLRPEKGQVSWSEPGGVRCAPGPQARESHDPRPESARRSLSKAL